MRRLAAAAAVAVLAGCGGAEARDVRIAGGTVAQRQLLRELVRRSDTRTIRELRLLPRAVRRGGARLQLTSDGGAAAYVEEALVAAEFVRASRQRGLPFVGSLVFDTGAARGDVVPLFETRPADERQVGDYVRAVREAATRSGADVEELRTPAVSLEALVLRLRVDDPARFLKYRAPELVEALRLAPPRFVGYGVDVVADAGRFFSFGSLPNGFTVFVRPDLEGCSPIDHSRPASAPLPRCPA